MTRSQLCGAISIVQHSAWYRSCAAASAAADEIPGAVGVPAAKDLELQRPGGLHDVELPRELLQSRRVSPPHAAAGTAAADWQPMAAAPRSFSTACPPPYRAIGVLLGNRSTDSLLPGMQPSDVTDVAATLHQHYQPCSMLRSAFGLTGLTPRTFSTTSALCSTPRRPSASAHGEEQPLEDASQPGPKSKPGSEVAASTQDRTGPAPDTVYNLPNAVSAVRLVSGPIIGVWLLQGHYEAATVALVISGASDWLDGYLARRLGASSVFGSFLDPLADKVLIGCVAGALLANGGMPVWLASVVVGRDVLLVSGAFIFRLRGFGWRWPGRTAFFRTADLPAPTAGAAVDGELGRETVNGSGAADGVPFMRPLFISKANTVLQLLLLGGYLTRGMYGWPDGDPVAALEVATAVTTVASLAAYGTMALQGRVFK